LSDALSKRLNSDVGVTVRTAKQLEAIIAANPLGKPPADPKRFFVAFLSKKPSAAAAKALDPKDFAPEKFWLNGSEAYAWCPRGAGDTKLGNDLWEKRLSVGSTMRNWTTVTALAELAKGP
jgi:uncharacterized protein (DUF1697 family)